GSSPCSASSFRSAPSSCSARWWCAGSFAEGRHRAFRRPRLEPDGAADAGQRSGVHHGENAFADGAELGAIRESVVASVVHSPQKRMPYIAGDHTSTERTRWSPSAYAGTHSLPVLLPAPLP